MTENQADHGHPSLPDATLGDDVSSQPADDAALSASTTELDAPHYQTPSMVRPRMLDFCTDQLLPDLLITDVTATRFIRPQVLINARHSASREYPTTVQPAVVPRTLVDPAAAVRRIAGSPGATWLSAQGGVSLIPDWNHSDLFAQPAETVAITNVAEFIATRQLSGPDTELAVRLGAQDVIALTDGRPVLVVAAPVSSTGENEDLVPEMPPTPVTSEAGRYAWVTPPAPPQMTVNDLPTFLSDPRTPGGLPLRLTSEHVRELLTEGRTEAQAANAVDANGTLVRVVVDAATSDPDPQTVGLSTNGPGDTPTVQLAIALNWRQRWKLTGYTRGALLSTISLAPQEQTTIEIFSWDRRRTESDTRSTAEVSSNVDLSDTVRDTTDVLNETKKTSSLNWSAQAGLTVPIATYAQLTLGGSVQDHQTMDTLSRETTNHIHEAITKAATSVRLSRETKVSETTEIGSERRVTRTVSNQNLCHVLNLDYFEVLSKYHVTTSFDRAATRICALIPSPLTPSFTQRTVRAYESTLRANLLERDLLDGFDAVRMLAARSHACQVACEKCSCGGAPAQSLALPSYAVAAMRTVGQVWHTMQTTKTPAPVGGFDVNALAAARRWMYRFIVEILAPEVANSAWGAARCDDRRQSARTHP